MGTQHRRAGSEAGAAWVGGESWLLRRQADPVRKLIWATDLPYSQLSALSNPNS